MSLTDAYYWSQIILTLIAFVAAIAAYQQIQTMKRLEIMKILEAPHVKDARMILYAGAQKTGKKWWRYDDPDFDEKLEKAAAITLGSFDLAGIVARGSNRRFFVGIGRTRSAGRMTRLSIFLRTDGRRRAGI